MGKVAFIIVLAACMFNMLGCGGDSNGDGLAVVRIQSDSLSPAVVNVSVGDSVRWLNQSGVDRRIVSGTLAATNNPQVLSPISIRPNNTFFPSDIEADFGDTVRWRNDTGRSLVLDILDQSGSLIASFNTVSGDIVTFSQFPSAGQYTFQERNNTFFSGMVTLFGTPNPNNIFESQLLHSGDTFTRPFNTAGTFRYFVQEDGNTDRIFMTGSVVVR